MGELFEEDGGEIEVAVEGDAVALEVREDTQEGEVGLGGGLVEPLHPMRPSAVVDDVGEVGVQGEGKEPCGFRRLRHDG